ncbi:MAG: hypothetical protein Q8N05_13545 [Bacteroidota bacterium]|nr:hypothetical protein [Bacteroidota bacterium]
MKEMTFEQMEEMKGGVMSYCDQLYNWIQGTPGYQGDYDWLVYTYIINCEELSN